MSVQERLDQIANMEVPSNGFAKPIILKDSGNRRQFETGAVRDMAEGKGRCDLLPAAALLRLSRHYEAGARKYSARNWEKGIPVSVMIDSGMRHLLKYLDGQTDEDHLTAAAWNILGAMWMEEKRPELQDLPSRMSPMKIWTKELNDVFEKPNKDIPNRGLRTQNGVIDDSRK